MCSHKKIYYISTGLFILWPAPCTSGVTWGCWGSKTWSWRFAMMPNRLHVLVIIIIRNDNNNNNNNNNNNYYYYYYYYYYYPHAFFKKNWGYCNCLCPSVRLSVRPSVRHHWTEFNQICCVSCSHKWGVQLHFFWHRPLGPLRGVKR